MKVRLAYGKKGLNVEIPGKNIRVVTPTQVAALPNEKAALRAALNSPLKALPLREMVSSSDTVAIVFSDITRPQPRQVMLEALLEALTHVPPRQITLINALGTHRANTEEEIRQMLGTEISSKYHVVQHDAFNRERMACAGRLPSGYDLFVNKDYLGASVKILTGFIEPHLFAGFSGGPKAVLPGVSDQASILRNHGADMVSHPRATWGVIDGNPILEEMFMAARLTSPNFLLNVSLDAQKKITGVFAGDLEAAYRSGAAFVHSTALAPVDAPFDIVITSNSGYPLDLNLYQAVKGLSAAAQVVKPGGAIVIAAECWDGIPEHGEDAKLLQMADDPHGLLALIHTEGFTCQDQWQVQVQAQVQMKADVFVYSDYLDEAALKRARVKKSVSIEKTIEQLLEHYGADASICVLPEGPMTIPYVKTP